MSSGPRFVSRKGMSQGEPPQSARCAGATGEGQGVRGRGQKTTTRALFQYEHSLPISDAEGLVADSARVLDPWGKK